jgi:hypothetical protein
MNFETPNYKQASLLPTTFFIKVSSAAAVADLNFKFAPFFILSVVCMKFFCAKNIGEREWNSALPDNYGAGHSTNMWALMQSFIGA